MDISAILPLLLLYSGKKPDDTISSVLSNTAKGDKQSEALSSVLSNATKGNGQSETISSIPSSAARGNKQSEVLSSILGGAAKGDKQSEMIGALMKARGAPPEVAAVLSSALGNAQARRRDRADRAVGFAPVMDFINDDILGKLTKYFAFNK